MTRREIGALNGNAVKQLSNRFLRKQASPAALAPGFLGSPKRERGSATPMKQEKLPRSRFGLPHKFRQSEYDWALAPGFLRGQPRNLDHVFPEEPRG